MTSFACPAGFSDVCRMAEYGNAETFYCVCNIFRLTGVTAGAILLAGDAERLYTAVARSAGFSFLHFGHREMFFVSQVVDSIVANLAIIVVFFQVKRVTEHDRFSIFEIEFDVFGFGRTCVADRQHAYRNGQQSNLLQHLDRSPVLDEMTLKRATIQTVTSIVNCKYDETLRS